MDERYSIEVNDEIVEIYGDLTIEETFDFLNFFDKKGYHSVVLGHENSTLRLMRRSHEDRYEEQRKKDFVEEEETYKFLLKKEEESHKQTQRRLTEVEALIKTLFSDESEKVKLLRAENDVLMKSLKLHRMENDEEVKKLLQGFSYKKPEQTEGEDNEPI